MRLERRQPRNHRGKHRASRPPRRWRLVSLTGLSVTVALALVTPGISDNASPARSSRSTTAAPEVGTGKVDPAVEPYVEPPHLRAVTVGPEDVAEPVRMVLVSAG